MTATTKIACVLYLALAACASATTPPPKVGDVIPDDDGCNTCVVMPGGLLSCTLRYCYPKEPTR